MIKTVFRGKMQDINMQLLNELQAKIGASTQIEIRLEDQKNMTRLDHWIEANFSAIPDELKLIFEKRDGGYLLSDKLDRDVPDEDVVTNINDLVQKVWGVIGLKLLQARRYQESIDIFFTMYKKMLRWQISQEMWTHKGMPLVWISDNFRELGFMTLAKKFAMLTLVEDSIRDYSSPSQALNIQEGGVYFRLKHTYGMSHDEILRYYKEYFNRFEIGNMFTHFPEYLILEADRDWATEYPSSQEFTYYITNPVYLSFLKSKMDDKTGKALEDIAEYIMFCMPGCRTEKRVPQFSNTTDYDIICSIDGPISDFRSELGRYIICECKDWKSPVDFSTLSKFARILISTKTKFGILFSRNGITGEGTEKYASREHKKVFQDSDIIIAVIDQNDIDNIIKGKNLIGMLRSKYEYVRLDK